MGGTMLYDDSGQRAKVKAVSCPECHGVFLTHMKVEYGVGPEGGTVTGIETAQFIHMFVGLEFRSADQYAKPK
jgi:hypothetical protein